MKATPPTTTGLLKPLRGPGNEAAWRESDDRYRPIILGIVKNRVADLRRARAKRREWRMANSE